MCQFFKKRGYPDSAVTTGKHRAQEIDRETALQTSQNEETDGIPFTLKAGFHMIADDRGSQIAESSAIVCDHMETHFCDRLRSCDRDRRRSQKIEVLLRSPAIVCDLCDRLRSCDHMETKVLRSAIEMYPIIFLILTDDSTFLSHKARVFDYNNAHLL